MHPFTCQISIDCGVQVFLFQLIMNSVRYFPIAGAALFVLWIWKKNPWKSWRIQDKIPDKIRYEFYRSFATLIVFVSVGTISVMSGKAGWTKLYLDPAAHGYWYLPVSFLLLIVWHETYFYWVHRLMHVKPFFKYIHLIHHKSTNPSPMAAYSFSISEAFLEVVFMVMFIVVIPAHPLVMLTHALYAMLLNIAWHSGYEWFPSGFTKGRFTKWINTSTHHNMHHSRVNCNYGLYFNFWDRIMGTNHKKYDEYFESIVAKRESPAPDHSVESTPARA